MSNSLFPVGEWSGFLPTFPPNLGHTKLSSHDHPTAMFMRQVTQTAKRRKFMSTMRLVFDFDGTITQRDTIGELAQAAVNIQRRRTARDLQPAWDHAVKAYLQDFESYKTSFNPPESKRRDVASEKRFLSGMKGAEEASLSRVSESGIFAGLGPDDLFQMGVDAVSSGRVAVAEGFEELLNWAKSRGLDVDIISVNWSTSFIKGVLHPHRLRVVANDIAESGQIHGPQSTGSRITTAPDKLKALQQIVPTGQQLLYFGDSTTDLECLLYSHGVVMAKDGTSSLLSTLSRIGIDVPHIGSLQENTNAKLFWACDFRQVQSGILRQ
ncbi:haloacid dehalogenase-like hydrolase [Pochonia chlamydosporia 170]|uniref:Haloacid dehalogenase-like hydrolase n=1 Tax=Pochonia chlamydosporia 170 TaxID=1380566 RepID=A0A179G4N9_METCM|nr:haloacid dehalogenase-like hydrolase [Pochonia chlamydosporia 170]OAQ72777.1 haloacid dehalogenase-like hydrolase [Pochonia chlamydosporia 170]